MKKLFDKIRNRSRHQDPTEAVDQEPASVLSGPPASPGGDVQEQAPASARRRGRAGSRGDDAAAEAERELQDAIARATPPANGSAPVSIDESEPAASLPGTPGAPGSPGPLVAAGDEAAPAVAPDAPAPRATTARKPAARRSAGTRSATASKPATAKPAAAKAKPASARSATAGRSGAKAAPKAKSSGAKPAPRSVRKPTGAANKRG